MVDNKQLIDLFLRLVKIDSPSGKEGAVAEFITQELAKLGLKVLRDEAGKKIGGEAGNLITRLKGNTDGGIPILLNAHMDVVTPCEDVNPRIKEGIISSDGNTVLGGDDKAGIAGVLTALKMIRGQKLVHPDIEIVFTVSEETGLKGTKALDYNQLRSKVGFVLDGAQSVGRIIMEAPAQDWIKAIIKGKSAHAGVAPEEGINAIQVAGVAIADMKLGRIDSETTANIGIIHGGRATNIVPDEVEVLGEARSHNEDKLKAQIEDMCGAFESAAHQFGAQANISVERAYSSFKLATEELPVKIAIEAAKIINVVPQLEAGGGGSDANIFNAQGIKSVLLAVGVQKAHSTEEYITITDLVKLVEYILAIIQVAAKYRF